MRIGTQCDDMGLFIPLMIFKSEVIGMSKKEIDSIIETRMLLMLKEAKEKSAFLQKDISEQVVDERITQMAKEKCENTQKQTSNSSSE